jgi:hypothetical protein
MSLSRFQRFFIARPQQMSRKGTPVPTSAGETQGVGVFMTPQSLVTFPVASLATSVVWKLAGIFRPGWEKNPWVPLLTALLIGGAIFAASVSNKDTRPTNAGQWTITLAVAVLNSLFLAASALGVLEQLTGTGK